MEGLIGKPTYPSTEAIMSATAHHSAPRGETVPNSLEPEHGWHCSHFFYRFDRRRLAKLRGDRLNEAREYFAQILDPESTSACPRQQGYIVAGHKADFAVMAMGPDRYKSIACIRRSWEARSQGPSNALGRLSRSVKSPSMFLHLNSLHRGSSEKGLIPRAATFNSALLVTRNDCR